MNLANRILELLYDRREGFFLLEELAAAARLPRAGLEVQLQTLRQQGHQLEISPAHGVRLLSPVRLDAHLIERNLGTRRVGQNVICFAEVGSTNDVAMDSSRQTGADGLVVLADSQRSGRGRLGRRWISPPCANVLMSVVLVDPPGRETPHDALTIATGLAVAEGIEVASTVECELKWPNDVLHDGAKLSGILVETRKQGDRRCSVLGVGINASAHPPAEQVTRPATSILAVRGEPTERIEIVRHVLQRLDFWLGQISIGDTESLRAAWTQRCGMINQRVSVSCGGVTYSGRMLDVSPMEGLILSCDDGRRVHLPANGSTMLP